ncbi:restriction endonuclease subunit S [Limosilactobacillus reuteri]|uniref:Restriction endonuclease subunit S n=1 Tax=Limosilactobacillus reuteri TaxID=1598 RepID=A0A6A8CVZ5_LIMRT|nr:restriction endonuclease subunit S [Limosilactobacillus reuteri]MRG68307.1 restriction endonuclease subunit S [Limosilactobacillus reuteri]WLR79836.1 restriction endonuclease subunit S [Limosilactobacillus reuteri]
MDKKPEKLVPEVRFKGFTDDWEQHKLGDITIPIKTYPYTRKYETKNITKFKYIHYGDIHTGKAKKINEPSKLPSITKGNYSTLRNGDVVVADASEDYKGIADAAILLSTGAFSIIAGLHTIAFRPNRKLVFPMFIYYNLQTSRFKHYGYHVGTGLKVFGISSNLFFDYSAFHPSLIEQQEISKLIESLENLLSLQQRKLEILIKLKRSFLTKSMANSLDKNPELYFNSASVKWLKQKLSDLTIKEFKGNTKLNDTKPGKTEYLDAERLNGNVPLFIDKPINTLKSDILILWDGSKAGSVYYGFEGSLGSTLKAIRLNPKLVNSFFVYQQLKSKQDVIFNKYRTPNIPHVIKNFTKVYPIYFPSIAVQNKIARFLGNLDTLIEIQQKSIKDHKVIKKYLLQKLFI